MPTRAEVFGVEAFQLVGPTFLARLKGQAAANVTQASIATLTYAVTDMVTGLAVVASTALTISSVIYDTLQTDARWMRDSTGYNFAHDLAGSALPNDSQSYMLEYDFIPTSGGIARRFILPFDISTKKVWRTLASS